MSDKSLVLYYWNKNIKLNGTRGKIVKMIFWSRVINHNKINSGMARGKGLGCSHPQAWPSYRRQRLLLLSSLTLSWAMKTPQNVHVALVFRGPLKSTLNDPRNSSELFHVVLGDRKYALPLFWLHFQKWFLEMSFPWAHLYIMTG